MWITLLGLILEGWLCSIFNLFASWLLLSCVIPFACDRITVHNKKKLGREVNKNYFSQV